MEAGLRQRCAEGEVSPVPLLPLVPRLQADPGNQVHLKGLAESPKPRFANISAAENTQQRGGAEPGPPRCKALAQFPFSRRPHKPGLGRWHFKSIFGRAHTTGVL